MPQYLAANQTKFKTIILVFMLKKKYPNLCLECLALQKVTLSIVREILGGPRDEKEATKGAAALGTVLDLYMTA